MWLTCMYCQGGGHGDCDAKTASHGCQWVILGNCRCGRPTYFARGRPCEGGGKNDEWRAWKVDLGRRLTWPTYLSRGRTCYVFSLFRAWSTTPGGAPATLWGTFRSRSAAVGRDLPRFGALFVPGPPPLAVRLLRFGALFVAGPPRWRFAAVQVRRGGEGPATVRGPFRAWSTAVENCGGGKC